MNVFNIKKILRKATIFGMATTSLLGSPLPKNKQKDDDENGDFRLVEDDGIICSEDLMQGEWKAYSGMDDHLYRYESLENLVGMKNEVSGMFWKTATFTSKEENRYMIRGIRSDDREFSVDKRFDIRDRHMFDQLCHEFNKKLTVEIA